jgi:5S rRNA maturation endonuclease (ribonuclease M5)
MAALMPPKSEPVPTQKRIVAEYDYVNPAGVLLYQVVRFEPKDFRQRKPDGRGGWVWGMSGVERVLYRLPNVLQAVAAGSPVFVVEGEKDVAALELLGMVATCNVGGAGKWLDSYTATLAGAVVILIADKDAPGCAHVDKVARALHGKAREVYTMELPDRDGHKVKDAADWVAAGGSADELSDLANAAPVFDPETVAPDTSNDSGVYTTRGWGELCALDIKPQVYFLGNGFALGQVGVIFGQGGLGKSRVSLNIARNQVLGLGFAGLSTGTKPLRHLLMGSENSIHRLQHDVRKMSIGLRDDERAALNENIHLATLENPEDPFITLASPDNIARWKATIERRRPNVLWCDPWGDILDGEANSDEDTRATLQCLLRLLREVDHEAALVILAHSRTGARNVLQAVGYDAANFGKGSKALYSAARCVFNLAPGDETENPPVVVVMAKNNNGPRCEPFALSLDDGTMCYERDPFFDFGVWLESVNAQASGKGKRSTRQPVPLASFHPVVLDILRKDGPLPSGTLWDRVKLETRLSDNRVTSLLADCLHAGIAAKSEREKAQGGSVYYRALGGVASGENQELPFSVGSK